MDLPKTTATVKKSKWGRGSMYNENVECFCIMGFFLNQVCKKSKEELSGSGYPGTVLKNDDIYLKAFRKKYPFGKLKGSRIDQKIGIVNDHTPRNKKTQTQLTAIFKRHLNCQLVFKD